ncbi:MAG: efflux RND transporter permease subunit, partial [Burkholderiaceae bacterium]
MLNALVRFSIRFRGIVVALACTLAGYGIYALLQSQQDVFPEFSPPMAVIQTEAPGLSSEQVETLVTQPVENALGGAIGLRSMKSTSLSGLSVVTLVFDENTDIYRARQLAGERLGGLASELPAGVQAPSLLPLTSSTGVVMMVGLTSRTRSLMDVHDVAQWIVRPHLLGLPGIADAIVFGGETREFQVQVDPDRLARAGLSLQDVLDAARGATGVRGAGFLENANQRIAIATEGQAASAAALAGTVIRMRDGVAVRLGDVATVREAPAPAVGAASIGDRDGVMMVIEGQYGADTLALTAAIDRALAALRPALEKEGVDLADNVFRPADFIQVVVGHLRNALLVGGAMVLVVLFLFLYNVRTACISAVAIPLSLLATVIALHHF